VTIVDTALCDALRAEAVRDAGDPASRRLRRAYVDAQTTVEEFDFHASPELPAAQIRAGYPPASP